MVQFGGTVGGLFLQLGIDWQDKRGCLSLCPFLSCQYNLIKVEILAVFMCIGHGLAPFPSFLALV